MENGEVPEIISGQPLHPEVMEDGGDHVRSNASGETAPLPPSRWQDILKKESRAES
jgi:hypothetical protein